MIRVNNSYFKLTKPTPTLWDTLKYFIKIPLTLPQWIASFLLARTMVFIVLNPDQVKPQKPINIVFLTDDPNEKGTVIVNFLPKRRYKTLRDYLDKLTHFFSFSGNRNEVLRAKSPKDKAHIDRLLREINLLIEGKSTAKNCANKKFNWEEIHLKGFEHLDPDMRAYVLNKLAQQHGEEFSKPHETNMEFFTLQTADGVALDSVAVLAKDEEKKPMSERKFVITCLVRDQNFITWLKDFKYSADNIGCTVVSFNYRGIDYSEGRVWTQQNMIDDVMAQIDRLLALGAKPENIGLEGQCLGGAIATIVAAQLHERNLKVKLYSERSFRSLPHIIAGYFLPPANCNLLNPINWLKYLAVGALYIFTTPLVWLTGWSSDATSAWDKIPTEDKDYALVHNPHDSDPTASRHDGIVENSWASIGSLADEKRARTADKRRRGKPLSADEQLLLSDDAEAHLFKVSPKSSQKDKSQLPHFLARRQLTHSDSRKSDHMHKHMVKSFFTKFSQTPKVPVHVHIPPAKPYEYNPHSHVKIWLTNNPNVFMNLENQMRLISTREKNPHDTIHLVYDSALLNEHARKELAQFCHENNIIPVDVNQFPEQLKSQNERTLYAFYKEETGHLKAGGNLAVASDIIRWLSPVYSLGTYTDFDVPVDTTMLPNRVPVEAPLLLNIGSVNINDKEVIVANNDYVAVVDPTAAKPMIERIQTGIIEKLTRFDTDFVESTERAVSGHGYLDEHYLSNMRNRSEYIYIQKAKLANQGIAPRSSRELRAYLHEVTTDKNRFLEFNKRSPQEPYSSVIARLRQELKQQLTFVKRMFFSTEYHQIKQLLSQDDDKFLASLMKKEQTLYLKSIVVCTTGPIEVAHSLFGEYVHSSERFKSQAQPFSFNHYDLQYAFQSKNSISLHENVFHMLKFLGAQEGELNDSSWLEEGRKLQNLRQEKLVAQKKYLELNLPRLLSSTREAIKLQINKMEHSNKETAKDQAKKRTELHLLKQTLQCFHKETQVFDVQQFRQALIKAGYPHKKHTTVHYSHKTQELIEDLEKLVHAAIVNRLAKDKKISLAEQKDRPEVIPSTDQHHNQRFFPGKTRATQEEGQEQVHSARKQ